MKRDAWHTLSIEIAHGGGGDYLIKWFVNGKQVKHLQTLFGNEIAFTVHCSVENLQFLGDHMPTQENYALFDYVDFVPFKRPPTAARASSEGGSHARTEIATYHNDPDPSL